MTYPPLAGLRQKFAEKGRLVCSIVGPARQLQLFGSKVATGDGIGLQKGSCQFPHQRRFAACFGGPELNGLCTVAETLRGSVLAVGDEGVVQPSEEVHLRRWQRKGRHRQTNVYTGGGRHPWHGCCADMLQSFHHPAVGDVRQCSQQAFPLLQEQRVPLNMPIRC